MTGSSANLLKLLVVEDNEADQVLFEESVRLTGSDVRLDFVTDGVRALQYLRRQGEYAKRSRPDAVLLDLNLPRKDGREVLAEIKSDAALRTLPVIVFSTSSRGDDVARAYSLGATAYLTKPSDLNDYLIQVRTILEHFRRLVA